VVKLKMHTGKILFLDGNRIYFQPFDKKSELEPDMGITER
jgi:hypothetical protein